MKVKLKWFSLGFITAVLILFALGYAWNHRSENAVKNMPKEEQEMMLSIYPWLKSAQGHLCGPFVLTTPASQFEKAEAMISPYKLKTFTSYPQMVVDEHTIFIIDSKNRMMSIRYLNTTGEFKSYDFNTGSEGVTFFDSNLDGQFDVKLGPGPKNCSVYYDSRWLPVIFRNKRQYININGNEKEIKLSLLKEGWKFVGQK